ncbi:MAG: hypothetical protein LBO66_04480, partial [Deltaproteobacteria bacterium]|nr:hypothetical protein [Deltaproteobacteria bacterium]
MFPKIVRAGQDITTNFDIAGNAYGNSNAPYYDCQPGTNCVVEAIEPNGNIFRITGGAIGGYAVGGYGDDSSANNNKVILSAGNIAQHLYGGFVVAQSPHNSPLTANGNSLELTGGTVGFSITGANAYASAQVLETNIFANFNSVNIDVTSSLTDISNIYGADIINAGIGFASAEGNTVNIVNGIIKLLYSNIAGASVYSSYGDSTAIRNKVNISGGNIGVDISSSGLRAIYGGYASSFNSSGTAVAYFNEVNISAGILKGRSGFAIYGGYGLSPNGGPLHVSAMGNIVNISGGEVNGDVFGGTGASASLSRAGVATGNFVNVSGGLINGSVFGGEGYHAYPSGVATATGNEVTISGAPTFGANSEIYGGIAHGKGDDVTGNTLNFLTSGIAVKGLYNFARLNFLLPANAANGATILTVTDRAEVTYATVEVAVAGASSPLGPGDEFILIDATVLDGAPLNSQTSGFGARGVSLVYEFELLQSGNQLKAVVRKAAVNERVKALSEGFVAALG